MKEQDIATRVEAALQATLADPARLARYDINSDGVLDDAEVELVRRMIRVELQHRGRERFDEPTLVSEPFVLKGRFEVSGLLGRGGQAVTYLATDLETSDKVAIKELHLGRVSDWKAIELFEREADALRRLEHPSIPKYVDSFAGEDRSDVRFYLVQEFVFGKDLERELADGVPFDEGAATRLREQIFEVLEYLHAQSPPVVHRDIKPSNLIRRSDGSLVLVDFGAVQSTTIETIGGSTVVGTSGYMPMEQYMGRAVPSSDLYALGATLVHLLARKAPSELDVENLRLQFEAFVNVSSPFVGGLHALLEPAVEKRPADVAAARRAFETALAARPPDELAAAAHAEGAPAKQLRRRAILVALAISVGGFFAFVTMLEGRQELVEIDNIHASEPEGAKRVLFLGNSHTYWWMLPKVIARMVPEDEAPLWFAARTSPGVTLGWHWENGGPEALEGEQWDAVVLQPQGMEALWNARDFQTSLGRFETAAKERGTEPIVWVSWARIEERQLASYQSGVPGQYYAKTQDELSKGVRRWATVSEACPIGEAWEEMLTRYPEARLHNTTNGSGANSAGGYLIALMLYACIYDADPGEVTYKHPDVSAGAAKKLRIVASDIAAKYKVFAMDVDDG